MRAPRPCSRCRHDSRYGERRDSIWFDGRLRRFVRTFKCGIESGYPLCCVTRYTVSELIWPLRLQGIAYGGTSKLGGYVSCGLFHAIEEGPEFDRRPCCASNYHTEPRGRWQKAQAA